MYITPDRYRAAGFGLDVSDMTDAELRNILVRASSLVDVYCGIPMLPQRHSFQGGTITGEQHPWTLGMVDLRQGQRRVYPIHTPIKAITSFVVKFTNTYQVTINPADLYVNRFDGWAEVVSLAAVVTGIYPVGVNFGLYTPVAEVGYTYGYDIPVTGEQLYVTDANTYQASRGSWEAGYTIWKNGIDVTSSVTVDTDNGEVAFASANAASDVVTADYSYTLPDAISQATGIIATHLLGERDLAVAGMTGLTTLKIAEVALARSNRGQISLNQGDVIPAAAMSLLDSFVFRSFR